jgi:hypothetical protein
MSKEQNKKDEEWMGKEERLTTLWKKTEDEGKKEAGKKWRRKNY